MFVNTACTVLLGWHTNYAALLEYYNEHGTFNVPAKAVYECDLEGLGKGGGVYHYLGNLGAWLDTQRQAIKGKGDQKITPEQEALLQKHINDGKCI